MKAARMLVTTPIFYANGSPHLGHAFTATLADAFARYNRMRHPRCDSTLLATGTDEHGPKVFLAAEARGVPVRQFVDQQSAQFRTALNRLNISYDTFVRTTDAAHRRTVEQAWRQLSDDDLIYKDMYHGFYSVQDETFLPEHETYFDAQSGKQRAVLSHHEVEFISESNYKFRLTSFRRPLQRWLRDERSVVPAARRHEAQAMLRDLRDISISRPRERAHWGIEVPGDASQLVYVWFDALLNYATVADARPDAEQWWPPALQVIGKDILYHHAIYWPAMLMALGREPPRQLLAHAFWTADDQGNKVSKSRGNASHTLDELLALTSGGSGEPDALRYYMLRTHTLANDARLDVAAMCNVLNADLADTLGNLVSRCTAERLLSAALDGDDAQAGACVCGGESELADELLVSVCALSADTDACMERRDPAAALYGIFDVLRRTNAYFSHSEPWRLCGGEAHETAQLRRVLSASLESVRVCAALLRPFMPTLSARVLEHVGVVPDAADTEEWGAAACDGSQCAARAVRRGAKLRLYEKISPPSS